MAFKMAFDGDSLKGKTISPGIYTLQIDGFKPSLNKNKDGINFSPILKIVNNPDADGQRIFENSLSSKSGYTQWDFCHAAGLEMEDQGNGQYALPGTWDGDLSKFKADDPSTWVYEGPLTGRTMQVELGTDVYEGKESAKIRQYLCAIPDCETKFPNNRHITDRLKKK